MKYLIHYKYYKMGDNIPRDETEIFEVPEYQSDITETDIYNLQASFEKSANAWWDDTEMKAVQDRIHQSTSQTAAQLEYDELWRRLVSKAIIVNFTKIPD